MLEALKFAQGAVAKKDFVPALTHFNISKGTIKGYNGSLALSSPIELDIEVSPRAAPFAKAIKTCSDTVSMHVTPANKLAISSGKFKAFVECTLEPYPEIEPEGDLIELDSPLLGALKELKPFIGVDASRPWATGILFRNGSAFATNNIIIIEKWLGAKFPVNVNIPSAAINELLRIGIEPTGIRIAPTSVTFHFDDNRWLKTQVSTLDWPDLSPILDRESEQGSLPETFFNDVESLIPFVDDSERLFIIDNGITTSKNADEGAAVDIDGLSEGGCFNAKQLLALNGMVKTIDLNQYPAPCLFFGEKLRGAIVGIRQE